MASYTYFSNDSGLVFPVGAIMAWPSTTAPSGWAICNGASYSTANNPTLLTILGGSSTLPDLRGAFLRQVGTNGSYSGPSLRSTQADTFASHTHAINNNSHSHTYTQANFSGVNSSTSSSSRAGTVTNTNTGQATLNITIGNNSSDTDTAPYCYGINWIIKLDNI